MIAEIDILPKGLKRTEVGIIPCDWDIRRFGEIAEIERGKFTARPRNDPKYYGGNVPFIQTGDVVHSDGWIRSYSQTLNEEGLRISKRFPKGTLFFTIAANIGNVAISTFDTACPDSVVAIRVRKNISKFWLMHELQRRKLDFENLATHNAQRNINLAKLRPYFLPIPPLAEQEAIAEALGDADALIEWLEQLITKKRQLKQAAMQQLLRPRTSWRKISLLELADGRKEHFDDGDWIESEHITTRGIRLVQTGNIGIGVFVDKEPRKYIFESSFDELRCKELREGDLLICRLAEPAGRACLLPNIGEQKMVTSVDVTIFRPSPQVANRSFLANLFSTDQWFTQVLSMAGGTTHKRISRGSLGRLQILVPSIDKQNKIAVILDTMNSDILTTEEKLLKARQIKQGMMQQLLTGRIRLV